MLCTLEPLSDNLLHNQLFLHTPHYFSTAVITSHTSAMFTGWFVNVLRSEPLKLSLPITWYYLLALYFISKFILHSYYPHNPFTPCSSTHFHRPHCLALDHWATLSIGLLTHSRFHTFVSSITSCSLTWLFTPFQNQTHQRLHIVLLSNLKFLPYPLHRCHFLSFSFPFTSSHWQFVVQGSLHTHKHTLHSNHICVHLNSPGWNTTYRSTTTIHNASTESFHILSSLPIASTTLPSILHDAPSHPFFNPRSSAIPHRPLLTDLLIDLISFPVSDSVPSGDSRLRVESTHRIPSG